MKTILLCIVLSGVVALCGLQCSTSPIETASGGDDFPNMIADAGVIIHDNLAQEWQNPAGAETDPLSVMTTAISLPAGSGNALPKRLSLPKVTVDTEGAGLMFDTAQGTITYYRTWSDLLYTHSDSITFRVSGTDTLIVRVAVDKVLRLNGLGREYGLFTDADGDSLLINTAASRQEVAVFAQKWQLLGVSEILLMRISAGDDGSFDDTLDNAITAASFVRLQNADTIYEATLSDADGDGVISRIMSGGDSALIDISLHNVAKREVALMQQQDSYARMVVFADSTKNYAIRYSVATEYLKRKISWTITTTAGDSTFFPGDTVSICRITTPLVGDDTLSSDTLRVTALLGSAPADSVDDALLGLYAHATFSGAKQRDIVVDYRSTTPVAHAQAPHDGTVYSRITDNEGRWIELDAELTDTSIVALVQTSAGGVYHVVWDRFGALVEHAIVKEE